MERRDVLMIRDGALAAGLSFFLYKLTSSATFFIIPLLLAAPRLIDAKRALLPIAAVLILLLGDSLIGFCRYGSRSSAACRIVHAGLAARRSGLLDWFGEAKNAHPAFVRKHICCHRWIFANHMVSKRFGSCRTSWRFA